jgi:hypothetical protein
MPLMQSLPGAQWNLNSPDAKLVTISRRIRYLPALVDDANRTTSVLNRSMKLVNVVNMVNFAEHVMSYATPNPADDVPQRL